MLLDFAEDIPFSPVSISSQVQSTVSSNPMSPSPRVHSQKRVQFVENVMINDLDVDIEESQLCDNVDCWMVNDLNVQQFMQVTDDQWQFLCGDESASAFLKCTSENNSELSSSRDNGVFFQRRSEDDQGCGAGSNPRGKGEEPSVSQGKSKKKTQEVPLDHTRTFSPTSGSDPRMKETTWPCFNQHTPMTSKNRYAQWKDCRYCGVRLEYTPTVGSPANTLKMDHGPTVVAALERVRSMGLQKEDLEPNTIKHSIKLVAAEQVVSKPKMKAKSQAPRVKGYPVKKPSEKPIEELEVPSDDSFEMTETKVKTEQTSNQTSS